MSDSETIDSLVSKINKGCDKDAEDAIGDLKQDEELMRYMKEARKKMSNMEEGEGGVFFSISYY